MSAAIAVWVTLRADFLAHPAWLAVQKADFILGPIFVGLYWRHRRPTNPFGLLLIVLGLLGVPYILQSLTQPTLFGLGVVAEDPIYVMTTIVILAFPTGRLAGRPERLVLALLVVTVLVVLVITVNAARLAPGFSISECAGTCPGVGLALSAWRVPTPLIVSLVVAVALATAAVIAWRFATATRPRRRALAIGAPIAVLFLLVEAAYRGLFLLWPHGLPPGADWVEPFLQWALAATRSFIWYGFLFALIAAELQAGRVLRGLVRDTLGRPSFPALESMLRGQLADPALRLGFWSTTTRAWVDADGAPLEPPGAGQAMTEIEREGTGLAIVHDAQLSADPELLQAAGAAALLAQENAALDAAWQGSLRELADSRSRLASAAERERRKLERDLHDGAQQRLVAASINLTLADEAVEEREVHERIERSRAEIEQAITELRELAHGIYPTTLARWGLARAFDRLASRHESTALVTEAAVGRFAPEIELALYYCGLEAVQNASKHAGRDAGITLRLYVEAERVHLEVHDDGAGFDTALARDGVGLQNMRDRIGAIGGQVDVTSEPGGGTLVAVSAPVRLPPPEPAQATTENGRAQALPQLRNSTSAASPRGRSASP